MPLISLHSFKKNKTAVSDNKRLKKRPLRKVATKQCVNNDMQANQDNHHFDELCYMYAKGIMCYVPPNHWTASDSRLVSNCNSTVNRIIRECSKVGATTKSAIIAELEQSGMNIGTAHSNSRSESYARWVKDKLEKMDHGDVLATRYLLSAMAHTCTGARSDRKYMKYSTFRDDLARHDILVGTGGVETVSINGDLDLEKKTIIKRYADKITSKCPVYYEHYYPVTDAHKDIANAMKDNDLDMIARKLRGMLTCYVTVFENSNIEHQVGRKDPWQDYEKAKITICDLNTGVPIKTEKALLKYIEVWSHTKI